MSIWDILGVPKESDLKTIKKAYAKLLKENNPEDNAEEYQKLREAYDEAIKYKKREKDIIKSVEKKKISEDITNNVDKLKEFEEQDESKDYYYELNDKRLNSEENIENEFDKFMEKLMKIYTTSELRVNLNSWKELINSEELWNLEYSALISEELFRFVVNNKCIPSEAIDLMNKYFNWDKDEIRFSQIYGDKVIKEIKKRIKNQYKIRYEFLYGMTNEEVDKFVLSMEEIIKLVGKRKYSILKEKIDSAYEMYSSNLEFMSLSASIYFSIIKNYDKAIEYYNKCFELSKNDLVYYIFIGSAFNKKKEFDKAIYYINIYLDDKIQEKKDINKKEALYQLAYAHYYSKNFVEAKVALEEFNKLKVESSNTKKANKYLKKVDGKLSGKKIVIVMPDLEWIEFIWTIIKAFLELIFTFLKSIFEIIFIAILWEAIKLLLLIIWTILKVFFEIVWEILKGFFEIVWEILKCFFEIMWEILKFIWEVLKEDYIWFLLFIIFNLILSLIV